MLPNKALQQTGLSVAALPLAPAAERRYVSQTREPVVTCQPPTWIDAILETGVPAYPKYDAPISEWHSAVFESSFIALHPFWRGEIPVSWSEVASAVGLSVGRLNRGLLTWAGASKAESRDSEAAARLNRFRELSGLDAPIDGACPRPGRRSLWSSFAQRALISCGSETSLAKRSRLALLRSGHSICRSAIFTGAARFSHLYRVSLCALIGTAFLRCFSLHGRNSRRSPRLSKAFSAQLTLSTSGTLRRRATLSRLLANSGLKKDADLAALDLCSRGLVR